MELTLASPVSLMAATAAVITLAALRAGALPVPARVSGQHRHIAEAASARPHHHGR